MLASLGDSDLVSSRWLQAHGYSRSLVARYVASGWLVSPARWSCHGNDLRVYSTAWLAWSVVYVWSI
ncbi:MULTISPECIES: AbiEi antitoxin N-terminal domain-containing protein [unclassified Halomonas]|uniref:AbiEi antitoxin N-terminal domain-containing protein n=1 Tax=unclassified Halomonas TaxID=2609666 RepID=UPI0018D32B82